MKRRFVWSLLLVLGFVFVISACASLQKPVVLEGKKSYTVDVKMTSSTFQPNNIQTYQGDTIVFMLENVSAKDNNFTIKDPDGRILQSMDIPSGRRAEMKVDFARAGVYTFFSNKFMKELRGMKGQIVSIAR